MIRTTTGPTHSTPAHGLRIAFAGAALLLAGILAGCGSERSSATSAPLSGTQGSEPNSSSGQLMAVAAVATPPSGESYPSRVISLGDSLPPEVMATVEDTLVRAGEVVEITAQGSDDVSQVGLSDGIGRMQLFTRAPASNVWHVLYRVPLNTRKDKLALSVTALNDVNRWRRVWVFVQVNRDQPDPEMSESHSCDDGDVDATLVEK